MYSMSTFKSLSVSWGGLIVLGNKVFNDSGEVDPKRITRGGFVYRNGYTALRKLFHDHKEFLVKCCISRL